MTAPAAVWPQLPPAECGPTLETLHLWTQVVGKVRLALTPWLNHSWHVPLYVSARGLTTGLVPVGAFSLEVEFDLMADTVVARSTHGEERRVPLRPQSVATFYAGVMAALADLGVEERINETPNELPEPIPFGQDTAPRPFDPQAARSFWLALVQVQ